MSPSASRVRGLPSGSTPLTWYSQGPFDFHSQFRYAQATFFSNFRTFSCAYDRIENTNGVLFLMLRLGIRVRHVDDDHTSQYADLVRREALYQGLGTWYLPCPRRACGSHRLFL